MATITKRVGVRGTTYNAKVRIKGHKPASESFTKLSKAREWVTRTEAAMREGRYSTGSGRTLGQLIDKYNSDIMPGKEPWAQVDQVRQLAWWRVELGDRMLPTITHFTIIETVRDKLAKGITKRGKVRTAGTINRYLAALSHVYTTALQEWEGWVDSNPVLRVKKTKEPPARRTIYALSQRMMSWGDCWRLAEPATPLIYTARSWYR